MKGIQSSFKLVLRFLAGYQLEGTVLKLDSKSLSRQATANQLAITEVALLMQSATNNKLGIQYACTCG